MLAHKVHRVLYSTVLTLALVAAPYKVTLGTHFLELHRQTAWSKDRNNGRGGGNTGSKTGGKGDKGTNAAGGKSVATDGSTMEVRHSNGMSERIKDGRYVMKDARGRIIINRTATTSDQSRLRSFR